MEREIRDYDPTKGMAFQGDVSIIPVPADIAKTLNRDDEIAPVFVSGRNIEMPAPFADRVRDLLDYAPETGIFTWKKTMGGTAWAGTVAGAPNSAGYSLIKIDGKKYQASRLAWLWVHGSWPENYIDHINGDRLDNRLVNLREATPAQNKHNSGPAKNSTSGVKGVFWNSKREKWQARICLGGEVRQHLGYFNNLEDAKTAYEIAELHHRAVFAAANRSLILQSGEVTGHHHAITLLDRRPAASLSSVNLEVERLLSDAIDGKIALPTARMYRDVQLYERMRAGGILTRTDLCVGVLEVTIGPMALQHPEHDGIRIPVGCYVIGRQIESAGAEERRVQD